MIRLKEFFTKHYLLIIVLLIAAISHGLNMFSYPYYENDEGAYMSQAWSILSEGKLAPYTYWYDHAPGGWMLIALWVKLTGGFFTFGVSINSGRVLMLLLHVLTTFFLYRISFEITKRPWAGVLAALFFSLSPLAIYFQRRVLLDNIMIFWVFLSLWILFWKDLKLRHIYLSALAFGIAVLTKENAIFFIPAFIYLVFTKSHDHIKRFAVIKWLTVSGIVISLYFLYASLNSELWPAATGEHVSLLTTLKEQATRGVNLPFWNKESDFYSSMMNWWMKDKFLMITGIAGTIISLILSIRVKEFRLPVFLSLLFWLFLMRGKLVIDFYIVPLIPLMALSSGILIDYIVNKINFENKRFSAYSHVSVAVIIAAIFIGSPIGQYTNNETKNQISAINWIRENIPQDTFMVIDNYAYVDLRVKDRPEIPVFPNAEWFWKVSSDPDIRDVKFQGDWKQIEYVALSHEMLKQIKLGSQDMMKNALDNSTRVADWHTDSIAFMDVTQYLSTNGDWMSIYKTKDQDQITLDNSWKYYKENFIHSYGQVIDPNTKTTTSEAQSYAMLRSVWQKDKSTFDGVWQWTADHMQYRTQDKLFSWLWAEENGVWVQKSSAPASDADEDIALALLFAYKQWGEKEYLTRALEIISDIWENEVVLVDGHYYLLSAVDAETSQGYIVNPSYISPATYKIFAEADPLHPWNQLATDSYFLLNKLSENNSLPPNWIIVDKATGQLKPAATLGVNATDFGFDAFRVMWRVALDYLWFKDTNAVDYLKKNALLFDPVLNNNRSFTAIYDTKSLPLVNFNSISTTVAPLSVYSIVSEDKAKKVNEKYFESEFNEQGFWGGKENYYDQNWAWFGTALYNQRLINLWEKNL